MQTPEEYVVGMFGPCDKSGLYGGCSAHESVWEVGERCRWTRNFVGFIRARDAEVRADERGRCSVVHATLTDEALVDELVRRGVLREVRVRVVTSEFTVPDRGGPRILRRRYVSEWDQPEEYA